eukprot:5448136-Pyramimonas_sp.AAC.1
MMSLFAKVAEFNGVIGDLATGIQTISEACGTSVDILVPDSWAHALVLYEKIVGAGHHSLLDPEVARTCDIHKASFDVFFAIRIRMACYVL